MTNRSKLTHHLGCHAQICDGCCDGKRSIHDCMLSKEDELARRGRTSSNHRLQRANCNPNRTQGMDVPVARRKRPREVEEVVFVEPGRAQAPPSSATPRTTEARVPASRAAEVAVRAQSWRGEGGVG